jgi:hypothetical protein
MQSQERPADTARVHSQDGGAVRITAPTSKGVVRIVNCTFESCAAVRPHAPIQCGSVLVNRGRALILRRTSRRLVMEAHSLSLAAAGWR